jgi:hypothetical protein
MLPTMWAFVVTYGLLHFNLSSLMERQPNMVVNIIRKWFFIYMFPNKPLGIKIFIALPKLTKKPTL